MKMNYQKPSMSFVDLRSEKKIAATDGPCMAAAAHGNMDFYYDVVGNGWIHIRVADTNCSGTYEFMRWEANDANPDAEPPAQSVIDEVMAKIEAILKKGTKQEFDGAYYDPQDDWS